MALTLRQLKYLSFPVLISSLILSCKHRQPGYELENEIIDPLDRELGSGFDSITNQKLQRCVDIKEIGFGGAQTSNFKFMSDATTDELIDETDIGIFGGVNLFGFVKLKASGDMITTLASTNESGAYVYKFEVDGKNASLPKAKLNDFGMDAYNRRDPIYFRKNCGDQFVDQIYLSAKLFVGVKYTFTSKEAKEKMLAKLEGSALWGLIKFSKEWTKENSELLKNVRVSVEAFQMGGDPRKLEELKRAVETRSCSGNESEKCAEALDRILEYGKKDFPDQLKDLKLHEGLQGPAILVAHTKSFGDQDIYDNTGTKLVNIEIGESNAAGKSAADSLSKLLRMEIDLKVELMRLQTLSEFPLNDQEKGIVTVAKNGITEFLNSIQPTRDLCNQALADSKKAEECSASTGRLLNKSEPLLKPVELPSRQ